MAKNILSEGLYMRSPLKKVGFWKSYFIFGIIALKISGGKIIVGFWIGSWLHDIPDTEFDSDGKQVIVKYLCFGPLETRLWCKLRDGRYCYEHHFIEGLQGGERYINFISKSDMLKVIEDDIAFCKKYGEMEMVTLLQAEKKKINEL